MSAKEKKAAKIRFYSSTLASNMRAAGRPAPSVHGDWQAHHVVPLNEKGLDDLRKQLLDLEVDFDHPSNGAWMRASDKRVAMDGIGHNRTRETKYIQWIEKRFDGVASREDAYGRMSNVGKLLEFHKGAPPWSG